MSTGQHPQSAAYRTLLHDALLAVTASTDEPARALSEEAVECALAAPQVIALPKLKLPVDAAGAALLRPLLDVLRTRGCSAKAAQYVLHYGVTRLGDGQQPALAALLKDMESQG